MTYKANKTQTTNESYINIPLVLLLVSQDRD
jgi:hypothetical protein